MQEGTDDESDYGDDDEYGEETYDESESQYTESSQYTYTESQQQSGYTASTRNPFYGAPGAKTKIKSKPGRY